MTWRSSTRRTRILDWFEQDGIRLPERVQFRQAQETFEYRIVTTEILDAVADSTLHPHR